MFSLTRLIKFLIVGASGVFVNYIIYFPFKEYITFNIFGFYIDLFWFIGILISAISNYILDEIWTFKDK